MNKYLELNLFIIIYFNDMTFYRFCIVRICFRKGRQMMRETKRDFADYGILFGGIDCLREKLLQFVGVN